MTLQTLGNKTRGRLPLFALLVKRGRALLMGKRYRPELHYMRGPGPKALAKAVDRARSGVGE